MNTAENNDLKNEEEKERRFVYLPCGAIPSTVYKYVFTHTYGRWHLLKKYVRENRKNPTKAEHMLWQELRNRKLGYKIRRQHAFDFLIVDFVCILKKLVIEVDGGIHDQPQQAQWDIQRTKYLNEKGFEVLRIRNEEVYSNMPNVLERIKRTLDER